MSNTINQVNYDVLTQIAKQFHAESEDYERLNAQTRQRMDALQGGWQGDAAKSFFHEMNGDLLPASQRLVTALLTGETVLNQIMQIIHQADEETASYFKVLDAYSSERREQVRKDMQTRYDELKNAGKKIPDTTDVYDSKNAIDMVLDPANRKVIEDMAKKYGIDPALLAGAIAAELDLDYDKMDALQNTLGGLGDGPGYANVHSDSLKFAKDYLNTNRDNFSTAAVDAAQKYDRSVLWVFNKVDFKSSTEGAAIVLAMYTHVHGGASSADDMATIWGAYKSGIAGFVPGDAGQGYGSIADFKNNIANGASDDKFKMGSNAYYAQPYFSYFQDVFSQPAPIPNTLDLPTPQIKPTPTPPTKP